ncbi:MAG: hypothetical protein ACFE91_02235 [Promethearchaeota archaeon]
MKTRKNSIYVLAISFLLLLGNKIYINEGTANPLIPYGATVGGFILVENSSCSMPYANVLIEIDATNPNSHFDLDFMGNYPILNPNDSMNVTIIAPFSLQMFSSNYTAFLDICYEYNQTYLISGMSGLFAPITPEMLGLNTFCTIKVNNTVIPYEAFGYCPDKPHPTIKLYAISPMILIFCNITLPKNDTLVLEYSFNTCIATPSHPPHYEIRFIYYVGTSRTWNGNITETVEYRVKGEQPDYIDSVENCSISNTKDGNSYLWEWNNERIYEDYVALTYDNYFKDYNKDDSIPFGNSFLIFTLIGIALMITFQKFKLNLKS